MATTQVETVSSGADKAKLAAVAALVVAAIAGFYLLSKQGPIVQWLVLLVGLAAAAGTAPAAAQPAQHGRRVRPGERWLHASLDAAMAWFAPKQSVHNAGLTLGMSLKTAPRPPACGIA